MKMIVRRILCGLIGIIILSNFYSCENKPQKQTQEKIEIDTLVPLEPVLKYGILVDSFRLVEGVIKSNQYLSQILNEKGVSMRDIDRIAKNSKTLFDVRRIQSGKNYSFFF